MPLTNPATAASSSPSQQVFASGRYYFTAVSGIAGVVTTNQRLTATPFLVPVATTFDRIGIHVTGAVAATTVGLAIYGTTGGLPNSLVLDAGTVDSSSGGGKENVISQALAAGLYWLATLANGGTPSVLFKSGGNIAGIGETSVASLSGTVGGYYRDIASATFPNTFGAVSQNGNTPLPVLRAA